jgi:hypothetical protein
MNGWRYSPADTAQRIAGAGVPTKTVDSQVSHCPNKFASERLQNAVLDP